MLTAKHVGRTIYRTAPILMPGLAVTAHAHPGHGGAEPFHLHAYEIAAVAAGIAILLWALRRLVQARANAVMSKVTK